MGLAVGVRAVDLVEHQDSRRAATAHQRGDALIEPTRRPGDIDEQTDHVGVGDGAARLLDHKRAQLGARVVDAGCIDKNNLRVGAGQNATDRHASRLRLGRDDRYFLAEQSVEQRRLADVGLADQGDEAGAIVRRRDWASGGDGGRGLERRWLTVLLVLWCLVLFGRFQVDEKRFEARQACAQPERGRRDHLAALEPILRIEVEDRRFLKRLYPFRFLVGHHYRELRSALVVAHLGVLQRERQLIRRDAFVQLELDSDHLAGSIEQQRGGALALAGGAAGFQFREIPVERPGIGVERDCDHNLPG